MQLSKAPNPQYDLEERTFLFAKNTKAFIKILPRTITNIEYCKQLSRASSSGGANYIEANESGTKKEFVHKIRICLRETKESRYWLRLVDSNANEQRETLLKEASELIKIFGAILTSSK